MSEYLFQVDTVDAEIRRHFYHRAKGNKWSVQYIAPDSSSGCYWFAFQSDGAVHVFREHFPSRGRLVRIKEALRLIEAGPPKQEAKKEEAKPAADPLVTIEQRIVRRYKNLWGEAVDGPTVLRTLQVASLEPALVTGTPRAQALEAIAEIGFSLMLLNKCYGDGRTLAELLTALVDKKDARLRGVL